MDCWKCLAVLAAVFAFAFSGDASTTDVDSVDRFIQSELKRRNVPGAAVAVIQAGKVQKAKGYGLADVELAVPVTTETVFQWASLTKQFTAEAILLLANEGKLQLSDSIVVHYTNAPSTWSAITLQHLLTHTSGLKNYTSLPGYWKTVRKDYTPDELITLVKDLPLDFSPGEKMSYCNTGYFLLGLVVESVSGQPFADFLAARIFRPLGMDTARANHRFELIPHRATGYDYANHRLSRAEFASPTQQGGAGVLVGSLMDLVKWDQALETDKLLPNSVRKEMWSPSLLSNGKQAPYGHGWRLGKLRDHRFVAHSGRNHGFTAHFIRLPDDKLTVIVLMNADGDPETLARDIAAQYVRGLTLGTVDPQPDKDPLLTKRLEHCLAELAKRKDSEMLTTAFRESFSRSRRRHAKLIEDLADKQAFTFVIAEAPLESNPERVTRLVSYRLSTSKKSRIYTFALTVDDKVAGLDTED